MVVFTDWVAAQHFAVMARGGFRHVQHVRPNRGPTKMGPPREESDVCVCHFKQYSVSFWGLRPQTPTGAPPLDTAGGLPAPRSPGSTLAKLPAGARGGPTFFSEQGPGLSKSGPGHGCHFEILTSTRNPLLDAYLREEQS